MALKIGPEWLDGNEILGSRIDGEMNSSSLLFPNFRGIGYESSLDDSLLVKNATIQSDFFELFLGILK